MRRLIDISGALVRHLTPTAIPTPERYLDPLLKLFHHLLFLLLSLLFLKMARPLNSPARTRSRGDAPPRSLPFVYWRGAAHREKVRFSPRKKMRSTRLEFGRNGRSRGGEYFLGEVKIGRSGYNSRCTRSLTFPSSSDERRSAEQRRASSSARSLRDISPAIKMRVR